MSDNTSARKPKRRYYLADGSVAPDDTNEVVFTRQFAVRKKPVHQEAVSVQASSASDVTLAERRAKWQGLTAEPSRPTPAAATRGNNEPAARSKQDRNVASHSTVKRKSGPASRRAGNGLAYFILSLSLLIAGYLAQPWTWFGESASARNSLTASHALATAAGKPVPQTEAIENIRVGRRVAGKNPQGAESIPEPTAENSRLISLQMRKQNGCLLEMEFLWSKADLESLAAAPGKDIPIDVPEMGVRGMATVVAISDDFVIRPGTGNLVTGRFRHEVAKDEPLFNVWLDSASEPLGCTGNHPFWSEDREDFIRADQLQPNELVLSESDGAVPIARIERRPWEPYVYNLQVHGQHVYQVGEDGVLVHNSCILRSKMQTLSLQNGQWRNTVFSKSGLVYVVRDANTNEILKVGQSTSKTFVGRFEKYVTAGLRHNRSIKIDVFETTLKNRGKLEGSVRRHLGGMFRLPWDNTGGRLGRPGPGIL